MAAAGGAGAGSVEALRGLLDQLRVAKHELLVRTEELSKARAAREAVSRQLLRASAARREAQASSSTRALAASAGQDPARDGPSAAAGAARKLGGFLSAQLLPVSARLALQRRHRGAFAGGPLGSIPLGADNEYVFVQLHVAGLGGESRSKPVFLKVSRWSSFAELLQSCGTEWRLDRGTLSHLQLVDADGAAFLDDLNVHRTVAALPWDRNELFLRVRPPASIMGELVSRQLDPYEVAERVQRTRLIQEHALAEQRRFHYERMPRAAVGADPDAAELAALEAGDAHKHDREHPRSKSGSDEQEQEQEQALLAASQAPWFEDKGASLDELIAEALEAEAEAKRRRAGLERPLEQRSNAYFALLDCAALWPLLLAALVLVLLVRMRTPQYQRARFETDLEASEYGSAESSWNCSDPAPARTTNRSVSWVSLDSLETPEQAYLLLRRVTERMFQQRDYAGPAYANAFVLQSSDLVSTQLRLRQLLVAPSSCSALSAKVPCFGQYSTQQQEKAVLVPGAFFGDGSGTGNATRAGGWLAGIPSSLGDPGKFTVASANASEWTATATLSEASTGLVSLLATYDQAGYYVVARPDPAASAQQQGLLACQLVAWLRNGTWIRDGTRAVVAEFNSVNVNTGATVTHTFVLQQSAEGAWVSLYQPAGAAPQQLYRAPARPWVALVAAYLALLLGAVPLVYALLVLLHPSRDDDTQLQVATSRAGASMAELASGAAARSRTSCRCRCNRDVVSRWAALDALIWAVALADAAVLASTARGNARTVAADAAFADAFLAYADLAPLAQATAAHRSLVALLLLLIAARLTRPLFWLPGALALRTAASYAARDMILLICLVLVPLLLALAGLMSSTLGPVPSAGLQTTLPAAFVALTGSILSLSSGGPQLAAPGALLLLAIAWLAVVTFLVVPAITVVAVDAFLVAANRRVKMAIAGLRDILHGLLNLRKGQPT
jgi:hypothetical protein